MKAKLLGLMALVSLHRSLRGFAAAICIAILSMAVVDPLIAATLVGSTSDATGINGLLVDGVLYDVTFTNASYDTVYSSSQPTFFGNASGADDAATALSSALTAAGVTNLDGFVDSTNSLQAAQVPYADASGLFTAAGAYCLTGTSCAAGEWVEESPGTDSDNEVFGTTDFTTFVVAPLPAALPLFVSGVGVLGLFSRRKRKNAAAIAVT